MRVAEPLERGEQALPGDRRELHPADHLAEQQRVGEHRHVPAVLFERGDREDDGRGLRQRGDGGPGEVGEFHRVTFRGEAGAEQCSGGWPVPVSFRIRAIHLRPVLLYPFFRAVGVLVALRDASGRRCDLFRLRASIAPSHRLVLLLSQSRAEHVSRAQSPANICIRGSSSKVWNSTSRGRPGPRRTSTTRSS